jgi:ABC-type uncharacterized transport system ATPase subunit
MLDYDKEFYVKQNLSTLFRVMMHLVKEKNLEETHPIRKAIEEKLMAGLTEEESREFANLLYRLCHKHSLLAKKEKEVNHDREPNP